MVMVMVVSGVLPFYLTNPGPCGRDRVSSTGEPSRAAALRGPGGLM